MTETRWPSAVGRRGAVASPHPLASQAALSVLLRGGTAVDAAVAAGAALAVVYPHMTGLGGDSVWLIWDAAAGRLHALVACGGAAALATPAFYRQRGLAEIPMRGPLAALTVPGAVDGLWEAHRFGRERLGSPLGWDDLLADAINHARSGVAVSPCQARVSAAASDLLAPAGDDGALRTLRERYFPGNAVPPPGERLVQPDLARTLECVAREGGRAFYEGEVADRLTRAAEAVDSPIRRADLARHRSRWTEPLTVSYRDGVAASAPPPCQGLATLGILGILDALDVAGSASDADYVHLTVEATKLAFEDRDRWLADPDVTPVPVDHLLDPSYLHARAKTIRLDRATAPVVDPGLDRRDGDTIACVTADAAGNCVSLIQSLYWEWGSGVVAGDTGVVLQNRGAFFTLDPAHPNVLAPGKRPFHTLTPFMLLRGGRPALVAGTMGGEGQPQTLVALATRSVDFGLEPQAAVEAPRWVYGRTWGARRRGVRLEARFDPAVGAELRRRGHEVAVVEPWSDVMGHAQAIAVDPAGGLLVAAGDPRADGPALAV